MGTIALCKMKNNENDVGKIYANGVNYADLTILSTHKRAFHIWEISPKLQLTGVHKAGMLHFLNEKGYYKRKSYSGAWIFVKVTNNIIEPITSLEIKDFVRNYVWQIASPLNVKFGNSAQDITPEQFQDVFLNNQYQIFNDAFLANMEVDAREILEDTSDTAYFLFDNVIVCVKATGIEYKAYEDFEKKTFYKSKTIERSFEFERNWVSGSFTAFVRNISNNNTERKNTLRSAIGYLLHEYGDPSKAQAVILYDETITDKQQGGTGKGIIGQAIAAMKPGLVHWDGKGLNLKSQFLFQQLQEDTRNIIIDDVAKGFDIDRLNSILTEGISVEKKFKSVFHIPKEKIPKFLVNSNFVLSFEGTTRKRRQFTIELSDYYSSQIKEGNEQPVLNEHKAMFFSIDWSSFEWRAFDTFMVLAAQYYLKNGLKSPPKTNIRLNHLIQTIGMPFYHWIQKQNLMSKNRYEVTLLFELFKEDCLDYDGEMTQRQFSNKVSGYLKCLGRQFKFSKGFLEIT